MSHAIFQRADNPAFHGFEGHHVQQRFQIHGHQHFIDLQLLGEICGNEIVVFEVFGVGSPLRQENRAIVICRPVVDGKMGQGGWQFGFQADGKVSHEKANQKNR